MTLLGIVHEACTLVDCILNIWLAVQAQIKYHPNSSCIFPFCAKSLIVCIHSQWHCTGQCPFLVAVLHPQAILENLLYESLLLKHDDSSFVVAYFYPKIRDDIHFGIFLYFINSELELLS